MKKLLLCITIILCVCTYGWTAGVPFTGSIDAEDVDYPNTKSISGNPTNVKTAIDGLKTEIGNIEVGGLASIDDLPGDTVNDNKIDSSLINNATSTGLGVATFPNTTFTVSTAGAVSIKANVFQPYSATLADFSEGSPAGTYDLSGATITFGLDASDIPDISGTYATAGHDHSGTYEPADATIMKTGSYANLTAINAVSPSSGYLRYNGSAFVYDTPSGTEHDAVTLGVDADTILGLSTQQITLDTQTANYVFAGPATGEAADPTFRALVADDIPDLSGTYQTADAVLADLAALVDGAGVLTNDGSGNLSWGAGGGSVTTSSPIGDTAFTDLAAGNTYTNYGDADDDTINELFAAIDSSWPSGSGAPTDASYLTAGENATLSGEQVVSADGLSLIQAEDFATMRLMMGAQAADTSLTNIAAKWTVDSSGNVSGMGTIEPTPTEHPQAVLYDYDAPGETIEEKAMAYLWAEYVDGADDAENSSAGIAAMAAGSWFDWIWYDSSVGQVKVTRDLDVDGFILAHSSMGVEERINFYDSEELVAQITGKNDGVGVSQLTFSVLMGSTMTDFFTPCGNCGLTHFWKPIALPASTTSLASLNIPSGTAPSSPAEGDIYYDGTHLYFKPSGSAVDLLQTASGDMVYPEGTGIAVVSGGTAWGTTLGLKTTPGSGTDSEVYSAKAVDELVAGIEIDTINLTALTTDGTYQGITKTFTVDSSETNTAFGQAYHIDTDGELVAADASSADTAPCIGLAVEAGTGSKKVLLWGEIREDDWNWTPGGQVYLSTDPATTCGLTQTAPSGTGDQVHVIGIATSADTILLKMIDIGEAQ